MSSSTGAVMPRSMTRHLPQVEVAGVDARPARFGADDRLGA
jgi:hypothetical protein